MILFITTSTVVFTAIILILVMVLVWAETKLVNKEHCKLTINDDEKLSVNVPAGSTLLNTLATKEIFLPSACGGGGTCAMCKCQVLEGGGDLLATEKGHISPAMARDHWRLACQVKVRHNMSLRLPAEIFDIKKFTCRVRSNRGVATFIKELVVELPAGVDLDFKAGGYIQIDIPAYGKIPYANFDIEPKYRPDWDKFKIWDLKAVNDEPAVRGYSMANHPAEKGIIMLNVRIATPPPKLFHQVPTGIGSSYIYNLKPGDEVQISGPFGEFFIKDTEREMIYIGGGAGMAPMRSHIFHLFRTLKTKRKVSFWYGARSLREMFYDEDFKSIAAEFPNFSYNVALSEPMPEDNWTGYTGFIHQVVHDKYLMKHDAPEDVEYYMCGPPMMLAAVNKMLYNLGVEKEMIAFDEF